LKKNNFSFKFGVKKLNLESLVLPHLQKHERGGEYQSEIGEVGTTSRINNNNIKGEQRGT
jgi:hypothetical protein